MPNLLIRLNFINGQSNGNDLQNLIDNIQVNGTIVPEPATVAGGLARCSWAVLASAAAIETTLAALAER